MAEVKHFVFFDFEMICSNRGMPFEDMEAIRLGAVKYEIETEKVTYFDQYIRPTKLKPLSNFCKKLTGIHDSDLVDANTFEDVFASFLTWVGGVKKSRFFSWSKSDLTRLKLDAEKHPISSTTIDKIEARYLDFQDILSKRVSKNNLSVQNALDLYGLEFIGQQHNPMYDAYNTLRIYISFSNQALKSDLIMLNHFIFDGEVTEITSRINVLLKEEMKRDLEILLEDMKDIYHLKHAQKMIKKVKRLVKKYENILINRSGLFSKDNINVVRMIKEFYEELLITYQNHFTHSSKIMILDDHIIKPIKHLAI
ncbi:3'-5' exonuclease [Aquibacillus rhizosphaerae]|uniref:3'-5' exonuclease n=1 Tax=Aquibacillus rhizosphaerae TaxID=3051431 RepID=A0ABT7L4S4_9BACI|nr:3'-5' exonuclease [Aquibacillus sp. LR5S19]MDL4839605.1 3'-5' exonuclease [Aquibacillus sp. LR5S19]